MNSLRRWLVFTAPLLLALVLAAPESLARPGGGNTYRGSSSSSSRGSSSSGSSRSYSSSGSSRSYSSSSSSSGGGSSDGSGFCCLLFGILAVVIVISSVSNRKQQEAEPTDWSTVKPPEPSRPRPQVREGLERLRTVGPAGPDGKPVPFDPDFSLVLFEDFLYALYAKVHTARGGGQLETMAAYLSERARQTLRGMGQPQRVESIVVGAMHYLVVSPITTGSERVSVTMRFEANYTEVPSSGSPRSYYVAEEWTLVRATKAKSRSPENARVFKCPNCGAPLDGMQGNTCSYCQQTVNTGEFDWVVQSVTLVERESRGPQLGGDTSEEGTDLPTLKQPRVTERMQRLLQQDPEMSWEALTARLGLIFQEMQVAWSERQWEKARPYVSDSLFQTQLYWMGTYERAGLRNVTRNARITQVELARVVSDRYYVAITVRVSATGLDFTLRESDGQMVSGSQRIERRYTEYWTLIRSATARGKPSTDKRCPSCGAPLSINMAGQCTHCSARVSSGDFDWVLSRIEQDDSYQG